MKKRLISMLMAVLMIASLLPTVVFAADDAATYCSHANKQTVSVTADAEKNIAGVEATICKDCGAVQGDVKITQFASKWFHTCKTSKTVVVQKAACEQVGLTVSYCADCGKAFPVSDFKDKDGKDTYFKSEKALVHNYSDFHVEVKPTCSIDGWGYVLCKLCGSGMFIGNAAAAADCVTKNSSLSLAERNALTGTVTTMFSKTNENHTKLSLLVAATAGMKDNSGNELTPKSTAAHQTTINGNVLKFNTTTGKYEATETVKVYDYSGDLVCPDCGYVKKGTETTHTITVKTQGSYTPDGTGSYAACKGDVISCDKCSWTGGKSISAPPTTWTIEEAKAPTCTANGSYEKRGKLSSNGSTVETYFVDRYGRTVTDGTITAPGHTWVDYKQKDATCTENGKVYTNAQKCSVCGATSPENLDSAAGTVITAPGHKYAEVELVAATCNHEGLAVKVCSECKKYQLLDDTQEFSATNGVYNYTTEKKTTHVAADERANVKEATCLEKGYTGDKVCKFCGYVMEAGTETKLGDHTPEAVEAKAPTCTEPGVSKGTVCKVCGKVLDAQKTEPALGHKTELQNAKAATCTEAGYSGDQVCTVCKVTVEKGKTIPKLEHQTVLQNAKDATCTEKGYTGDKYCTLCKTVVEKGSETKALEHNYVSGICSRCDAKQPGYMPFTDVKTGEFYYNAVMWAYTNDVAKGTTKTTFGVNDGCTRAQIVTFLWRAAGSPAPKTTTNPFTDIVKGDYYDAILWAVENGITKGTSATTFDPNSPCTRGQIVTFLWRYEKSPVVSTVASFKDVPTTEYYYKAVNWAVANGITDGTGNGKFSPDATCTRAQAVTFLWRDFVK